MKKVIVMVLSLFLMLCGCSCESETFSVSKLETFADADIKTYGIVYKKYENGGLLAFVNVVSKCNESYCEYYMRRENSSNIYEYFYEYNGTNYILHTKQNGVNKEDSEISLTFNDKSLSVNIDLLKSYVNEDIEFYKGRNKDFSYKVEDKRYITEFKTYTQNSKLANKATKTYTFNKKNIDKFIKEKANYGSDGETVISTEKVEIEVIYDNVSIPAF